MLHERLKVAVLGAGGLVAQRLQQRLANHPWFELAAVAGSPRFHEPPSARRKTTTKKQQTHVRHL